MGTDVSVGTRIGTRVSLPPLPTWGGDPAGVTELQMQSRHRARRHRRLGGAAWRRRPAGVPSARLASGAPFEFGNTEMKRLCLRLQRRPCACALSRRRFWAPREFARGGHAPCVWASEKSRGDGSWLSKVERGVSGRGGGPFPAGTEVCSGNDRNSSEAVKYVAEDGSGTVGSGARI